MVFYSTSLFVRHDLYRRRRTSFIVAKDHTYCGCPHLAPGPPCADADSDGIPDAWESRYYGSSTGAPAVSTMAAGGYTVIEHYLNGTNPVTFVPTPTPPGPTPPGPTPPPAPTCNSNPYPACAGNCCDGAQCTTNTDCASGYCAFPGAAAPNQTPAFASRFNIPVADAQTAPYPKSTYITSVSFDKSSHKRLAQESDNWPTTWADNDNIYTSWGDGEGFGSTRVSLGVAAIEGGPTGYTGRNVWTGSGKSYGLLSIGGIMYMWVSPGSDANNYDRATLMRSTNHGSSWSSTGVQFTRGDDLVLPTILNFGKDYAGARDQFVYHYFIELQSGGSLSVQKPGRIHLARVDRGSIT